MVTISLPATKGLKDITITSEAAGKALHAIAVLLGAETKVAAPGPVAKNLFDPAPPPPVQKAEEVKGVKGQFKIESSSFNSVLAKAGTYVNSPTTIEYFQGGTRPIQLTKDSIIDGSRQGVRILEDGSVVLNVEVDPAKFGSRFATLRLEPFNK